MQAKAGGSKEERKAGQSAAKVFVGNTDKSSVVTVRFPTSIKARYVRLCPKEFHGAVALRWSLF
jgi:hypothetical protein